MQDSGAAHPTKPSRPESSPPFEDTDFPLTRMLTASRMTHLPSPASSDRRFSSSYVDAAAAAAAAARYGGGHSPPSELQRPHTMEGSRQRLPPLSQLFNSTLHSAHQPPTAAQLPHPPPPHPPYIPPPAPPQPIAPSVSHQPSLPPPSLLPRPPPPPQQQQPHHWQPLHPRPPHESPRVSTAHPAATTAFQEAHPPHDGWYDVHLAGPRTATEPLSHPASGYFNEQWRDANRQQLQDQHRSFQTGYATASAEASGSLIHQHPRAAGARSPIMPSAVGMQAAPPTASPWSEGHSPRSSSSSIVPVTTSTAISAREKLHGTRKLLGERHVPGEGSVFVYDDGTRIPTTIDGEPVNGQWGMTKAGRPRKRMPQACIACRQKKIKCDPGEGKCTQCEKTGKDCQYSHGHRGQKSSPTSPRTTGPGTPTQSIEDTQVASPHTLERRESIDLVAARGFSAEGSSNLKRSAPDDHPFGSAHSDNTKRPRPSSGLVAMEDLQRDKQGMDHNPGSQADQARRPQTSGHSVGYGSWAAEAPPQGFVLEDPFVTEADKAAIYLESFFTNVNRGAFCVFPQGHMTRWARNGRQKSPAELMILYSMLANGSLIMSPGHAGEANEDVERYRRLARTGIETASKRQGLAITLTRLIVGQTYVISGDVSRLVEINDVCRAVSLLKFELSERLERPGAQGLYEFGLNKHGLKELYLRTEWLAFVMDRLIAIEYGYPICIKKEDVFLRLPCDEIQYDWQALTETPFFDNGVIAPARSEISADSTAQSPWSHFLQVISLASEVDEFAKRVEWQDADEYAGRSDEIARRLSYSLERWYEQLPAELQLLRTDDIDTCVLRGTLGLFLAINALYHGSFIRLSRRVKASLMPSSSVHDRIRTATLHAERFLRKLQIVRDRLVTTRPAAYGSDEPRLTRVPFIDQAAAQSVDTLTACGHGGNLEECDRIVGLSEAGATILEQMVAVYPNYRPQHERIVSRLAQLRDFLFSEVNESCEYKAWTCRVAPEHQSLRAPDIFYEDDGSVTSFVLNARGVERQNMRTIELS